jgi:hypothetical protein
VRNLPTLSQQLNGDAGDSLAHAFRRALESGKAAAPSSEKLGLEHGQDRSVENDWKGLGEPVNRGDRDGLAGESRVMKHVGDERGRQEWKIDGQNDAVSRGGGRQRGANSGQRTKPWLRIFNNRRISGESGARVRT